jgi:hypothetical protein
MTRSLISGERLAAKSHRAPMRKRGRGYSLRYRPLYGLVVDHDRKLIEIRARPEALRYPTVLRSQPSSRRYFDALLRAHLFCVRAHDYLRSP